MLDLNSLEPVDGSQPLLQIGGTDVERDLGVIAHIDLLSIKRQGEIPAQVPILILLRGILAETAIAIAVLRLEEELPILLQPIARDLHRPNNFLRQIKIPCLHTINIPQRP